MRIFPFLRRSGRHRGHRATWPTPTSGTRITRAAVVAALLAVALLAVVGVALLLI